MFFKAFAKKSLAKFLKPRRYLTTHSSSFYEDSILQQKINQTMENSVPAVAFLGLNFYVRECTDQIGYGSSVIVDKNGLAITAAHCVCQSFSTYLGMTFGENLKYDRVNILANCECIVEDKLYPVKVLTVDVSKELALLQVVTPDPLPWLELAHSPPKRGQIILGSGCGNGLFGSVALGNVGFVDRPFKAIWDDMVYSETMMVPRFKENIPLLQTTVPLHTGDSGGGLFDLDMGRLIGVTSFGKPGLGQTFAVSVATMRDFINASTDAMNSLNENDLPFVMGNPEVIVSHKNEDYRFEPVYNMYTLLKADDAAETNIKSALSSLISPDGK